MTLKRKRSSPSFSSPSALSDTTTTTGTASPLPFFYQQSKPIEPTYGKPTWAWPTYDDEPSAQHLSSRTRKRHRDDRPDEQSVYGTSSAALWLGAITQMSMLTDVGWCAASTISRLYEAQRRHPDASPIPSSQTLALAPASMPVAAQAQKSTLHSFWRLPTNAPSRAEAMQIDGGIQQGATLEVRCEDCDRALQHGDAMDVDEGMLEQETACSVCRRHVCDTCAVLGNERICLGCANGR